MSKYGEPYSHEDIEYLRENYPTEDFSVMALYLGRTEEAVKNQGVKLGLKRKYGRQTRMMNLMRNRQKELKKDEV